MTTGAVLSVASGGVGLIGSGILAFSLGPIIRSLVLAWHAHETTIDQLTSPGNVVRFTGLEKHLEASDKRSGFLTTVGLILLALAFALQLLGAFF